MTIKKKSTPQIQVHIRATKAQIAAWNAAAKREGRSTASWVRRVLDAAAFAIAVSGCVPDPTVFVCHEDSACDPGERCVNRSCATADETCPSGWRFVEGAGNGRDNTCTTHMSIDASNTYDILDPNAPVDLGIFTDLSKPSENEDLSESPDLTTSDLFQPDLSTLPDLAPTPDLAPYPDLNPIPDLDLSPIPDITPYFDLHPIPDLTLPDLAPYPDLRPIPDLAPVLPLSSCDGLARTCGPNGNGDCCESLRVPGGIFNRSNDPNYAAAVSAFRLDRYEITVGRFRKFIAAQRGTQKNPPAAGDGAHPKIPGSGWDAKWNVNLAIDTAGLLTALKCENGRETWTDAPGANENLPINCTSWYEDFAFCAWDGGFLPTETEWNFAATGGSDQRPYPWSANANDLTMDPSYAVYNGAPIGSVGSKPKGDGKWGHADLGGNIEEMILDWIAPYQNPCVDCADLTPGTNRVYRGGNWRDPVVAKTSERGAGVPGARASIFGARCARNP